MTKEHPIGSLDLLECLAEDPFGTVHRGMEWIAPRTNREVLVRKYHPVWLERGLSSRHQELRRNLLHLGHLKPYKECHISREGTPHLVWPLSLGRSLTHVLRTAEAHDMPFGIDQALFLVWALSHHLRDLHQVQLSPGILAPHRIWIGFDGWVQLLDVPVMGILQELLPSVPEAWKAMRPYLQGPTFEGLDRDTFQLGALLFEVLTHHPLPVGHNHAVVLEDAQVEMADGHYEAIPKEIAHLLKRLLGLSTSFKTLEELECTMEDSLFGGDFDPSSFGLAFMMQALFRQEIQASEFTLNQGGTDSFAHLKTGKVVVPTSEPFHTRARHSGLLAAACLIGGSMVWLGAEAFTHTKAITPTSEKSPSPSIPSASIQTISKLPVPSIPVAPSPQHASQPAPQKAASPSSTFKGVSLQAPMPPTAHPVRLRVFVDEQGRVRQAHVISGATEGSGRERTACATAMQKRFTPPQSGDQAARGWDEITVMVP